MRKKLNRKNVKNAAQKLAAKVLERLAVLGVLYILGRALGLNLQIAF